MRNHSNKVLIFTTNKSHGSVKNFPQNKHKPSVLPSIVKSKSKLSRKNLVEAHQVHGSDIHIVDSKNLPPNPTKIKDCDGLITNLKNVGLIIKTADCIPIVFYDNKFQVIANIHAGWRGLIKGIHKNTVDLFKEKYNINPKNIYVYLGPSIRSCCYKFKDKPIQIKSPFWKPYISHKKNYYHIDMHGFLISELIKLGIQKQNISDTNQCTYHHKDLYYSHLRQKSSVESSGTMLTIVQLI